MSSDSPEDEPKRRETPPPLEFVRPTEAQEAPPPRDQTPAAWVPRPEEFGQRAREPIPQAWPQAARPSPRALLGGVLLILSGLIGAASAYVLFTQPLSGSPSGELHDTTASGFSPDALLVLL